MTSCNHVEPPLETWETSIGPILSTYGDGRSHESEEIAIRRGVTIRGSWSCDVRTGGILCAVCGKMWGKAVDCLPQLRHDAERGLFHWEDVP